MSDGLTPTSKVGVNGETLYQDGSGKLYTKDASGNACIFNDSSSSSASSNSADLSNTSVFSRNSGGKQATITIVDTNGNGFDNNDTIKFQGDLSLFSPDDVKDIMKNYKDGDTRTTNLTDLTEADDKKVKTDADKQYSVGSFMKLFSKNTDTTTNNNVPNYKSLVPGVFAALSDPGDGGCMYLQDAFDNMAMALGFNNKSNTTTGKADFTFADQDKAVSSTDKTNAATNTDSTGQYSDEDAAMNAKTNGAEAIRLRDLAYDESKYKAGSIISINEHDVSQMDMSFKTDDGTEYSYVGTSQWTDPKTGEKSFTKVFKSSDEKIAILKNSNESDKIIDGKRNDDGFVRGARRSIRLFNPVSNTKELSEKINPNVPETYPDTEPVLLGQKTAKIDGYNQDELIKDAAPSTTAATSTASKSSATSDSTEAPKEKFSFTINAGDSVEAIKQKLIDAHFDPDTADKIIELITKDGSIDPGTINLKSVDGAWQLAT